MRKKVLSLALVTVMALSLAACGAKEEAAAPAAEPAKEAAAPAAEAPAAEAPAAEASGADVNGDGKVVIGYISKNIVDPFHAPINEAAQQALDKMKADGVIDDWTGILDGETDPNKQIDRANDCIAKGCDIVIMLPAESEASDPALLAMNDEGIKVLEVNSKTASCDTKAFAFSVPMTFRPVKCWQTGFLKTARTAVSTSTVQVSLATPHRLIVDRVSKTS